MEDSSAVDARTPEAERPTPVQPLLSDTPQPPPNGSSVPEAQAPSAEPEQASATPSQPSSPSIQTAPNQPDHPACQRKPPLPRSDSDAALPPQGSPAADAARPPTRVSCPSSGQALRQWRSLSGEEQEFGQAHGKRQSMAKFVLGSFEDNSSDDELLGGPFKAAGRRRSSLASLGSTSSSVDSLSLSSLSEAGSAAVMRGGILTQRFQIRSNLCLRWICKSEGKPAYGSTVVECS
ncbi:UNVERIFIED_CONTAM: hypothetical protein K2H54_003618 [Gekko kuhli]